MTHIDTFRHVLGDRLEHLSCRRSAKIEQRFTLNFDQGWRAGGDPPAVDKCTAVAGADNGVVGVKAVGG
jgi:hypothetical protein